MELGARAGSIGLRAYAIDFAQSRVDGRRHLLALDDARHPACGICDDAENVIGHQAARRDAGAHGKVGSMNQRHSVQATTREHLLALPGDEMIRHAADSLTHAITVHCNRRELWPWLIQMGADRAGWYSYDMLDNGGRRSAEKILHGLQHPS